MCARIDRLMIIELGKYNSDEALLIGHMNTRRQRRVINRNMEQRASVIMAAVCMRETGGRTKGRTMRHI